MTLDQHAASWRDMHPHIATLQRLAAGCEHAVEFGVRAGVSTWALLDAIAPDGTLESWDIAPQRVPDRVGLDPRWTLHKGDSLAAVVAYRPDIVFIDTSHLYDQTLGELWRCAGWEAPLIVLHDWNLPDVRAAIATFCTWSTYHVDGEEHSEWGLVWLRP